ncbi:hypothetical protein [Lentilitoribacter sp. Alg239-R112]|uniref:hypothetical protein n=1 Tax=Lentilitoribacter sp. Alg239-R112 TaxID=2305987 RepID=UPI0013A6FA64|nr:hypothetical protein [Lentilitoribacter sp. Alg239-R112]
MADIERMKRALVNAHNAGDTGAAKTLANAIKAQSQAPVQEQQPQEARWDHKVGAAIDGVAQGLTFGYSDEMAAGMASGGGLWGDYDEELEAERARMAENKELAGGYELGGQIVGGLSGGLGLAKSGVTLLSKAPTVGKAALEGAAYGAAHGSGMAEEGNRLQGAATGAIMGAATGGLAQSGANALKSKLANRAVQKGAFAVDDVKSQAQSLYTKMRQSGLKIRESKANNIKGNIDIFLHKTTPELAPEAHKLKEFVKRSLVGDVDIEDMHNISKTVNRVSRSNLAPEDAHYVGKIKQSIDSAFDASKATDYKGPLSALPLKKQADELWRTARKSEIIDEIYEKAQNQATGFENGLVNQFRSLANNAKKMKQFTPDEQRMIKGLVRRGSARAILKGVGMLSPTSTFGALVTGGAGVGTGVVPAAALAATGYGSRKAAEAMTRGKANAIRQAVMTGQAPIRSTSTTAKHLISPLSQQSAAQTHQSANQNRTSLPYPKRTSR